MFWAVAFTLGDFTLHPVRTEATRRRETVLCLHQPRRFQPGFVTSAPVVLTGLIESWSLQSARSWQPDGCVSFCFWLGILSAIPDLVFNQSLDPWRPAVHGWGFCYGDVQAHAVCLDEFANWLFAEFALTLQSIGWDYTAGPLALRACGLHLFGMSTNTICPEPNLLPRASSRGTSTSFWTTKLSPLPTTNCSRRAKTSSKAGSKTMKPETRHRTR